MNIHPLRKNVPIIKTKQFTLRPFKKGDEVSLAKNLNNQNVSHNLLVVPYPYTLKDAKEWIAKNLKEAKKKEPKTISFVIDIGGEAAGAIGFHKIEKEHRSEVGYWLAEKHWGNGIMPKALKIAIAFGFKELKLRRIYAYAFTRNKQSTRTLEKSGFKFEGTLKKNSKKNNEFIDDYIFAKIK